MRRGFLAQISEIIHTWRGSGSRQRRETGALGASANLHDVGLFAERTSLFEAEKPFLAGS